MSSLTSPHGGKPILLTRRRLRHRHRHRRTISRSNSACTTEAPGTGIDGRDGLSPAYYRYLSAFLSCAWRPAFERSDIAPARRQLARTFWSHRLSRPGCRLASAAIADTPLRKDASRLRPRQRSVTRPASPHRSSDYDDATSHAQIATSQSQYQQGDTQNTADAAYPADALGRRTYRNGCNAEPTSSSNSAVPRLIRNPGSLPNKIIIRARIDNR